MLLLTLEERAIEWEISLVGLQGVFRELEFLSEEIEGRIFNSSFSFLSSACVLLLS